jgi:hypothetical protein
MGRPVGFRRHVGCVISVAVVGVGVVGAGARASSESMHTMRAADLW